MKVTDRWLDAVLRHRQPMTPEPTGIAPKLQKLPAIRAVVFDIYGTLVISGSGDVGSANGQDRGGAIAAALAAIGWDGPPDRLPTIDRLQDAIRAENRRLAEAWAAEGLESLKAEVDIVAIWRRVLVDSGLEEIAERTGRVVQLAAEYEARANPTWPMPGAAVLLRSLRDAGYALGIVSNAQVFSPLLVEDLLGGPLADGGFDLDLCVFSNRFRHAKPSPRLFAVLSQGLARRGIEPAESVYLGNDMLNDIWAASEAGLRTAWFAGDARSCRQRKEDVRCRSLDPDVVITELTQVLECLGQPGRD